MRIAAVVLSLASVCCTQTAQQGTPTEVPVENEPHHHLVFENEYVRVFKVEVPPHESTLVHRHSRDYVVVTIGDADVTNAVVGKEPKRWNFKDGEVTFLEASGEKSFAHKAVNEGEEPFVNYTIELKKRGLEEVGCASYLANKCRSAESAITVLLRSPFLEVATVEASGYVPDPYECEGNHPCVLVAVPRPGENNTNADVTLNTGSSHDEMWCDVPDPAPCPPLDRRKSGVSRYFQMRFDALGFSHRLQEVPVKAQTIQHR